MNKTLLTGAALTLFAAAMGTSGRAAAYPIYPTTPCTAANDGEITTVDTWRLPDAEGRGRRTAETRPGSVVSADCRTRRAPAARCFEHPAASQAGGADGFLAAVGGVDRDHLHDLFPRVLTLL